MSREGRKAGYVLNKGYSGMGNRLLSLLSSTLYARLSGRQVIIDWRDEIYSNNGENSFPAFFTCASAKPVEVIGETDSVRPACWRGRLNQFLPDLVRAFDPKFRYDYKSILAYTASQRWVDYPEEMVVICSYRDHIASLRANLQGDLSSLRGLGRMDILREMWNREYGWSELVEERVRAFVSKTWSERMIGVHVRQTDIRIPLRRYCRALDRLWEQTPQATLYVATDGKDVVSELTKRYGRVVCTDKDTSDRGDNDRLHAAGGDRLRHGIDAVVDMRLLSLCDRLVYASQSTFGFLSHIWMKPGGLAVDIDRWNPLVFGKHFTQNWQAWREGVRQRVFSRGSVSHG